MTTTAVTIVETNDLSNRVQDNPAAIYLASLSSPLSRSTIRGALDKIARIISGGQHTADAPGWAALRYQHPQAIRAAFAGQYKRAAASNWAVYPHTQTLNGA